MQSNSNDNYIDVPISSITHDFILNDTESNLRRYQGVLENNIYSAVVTDLDGVVLDGGVINPDVLNALVPRFNNQQTPLVIATGRSLHEVEKVFLADFRNRVSTINVGNLFVFANNGAHGVDIATGDVLESHLLDQEILEEAIKIDELNILHQIREAQLALTEVPPLIRKKSITKNNYTYTFGVNIPQLDLLSNVSNGKEIIEKFERLFGKTRSLFYVVQVINHRLLQKGINVEATTSGSTIDINTRGVNKGTAINYVSSRFAISQDQILSIGDSVYGNDTALTQREGGFVNVPTIIPGSANPIYIAEEGDQFQRVAHLLNKVKLQKF